MSALRGRWNFGAAFIAAWILVVQSVSGALALGQGQATQLDIFGNPLCIISMDSFPHGQGGAQHGGMLKCCTLGCTMFSQPLGAAPELAVEILDLPIVSETPRPDNGHIAPPARARVLGNPRAPPLKV